MAGVWQTGATWARSWARSTPCAVMFARRRDPRRRAGKAPRQPDGPVIRPGHRAGEPWGSQCAFHQFHGTQRIG